MYNPALGTFHQRDPIEADVNLYRYCENNPLTRTDPNGLSCLLTENDKTQCYQDCEKQYPHWWQYHLYVGCVNGCNVGAKGQDFTFCNYVNSWDKCYTSGLQCVCAAVAAGDMIPIGGPLGVILGGLDCACAVLTAMQEVCAGRQSGTMSIFVAAADCGMDLAGIANIEQLMTFITEGLIEALNEMVIDAGGGINSIEACREWKCNCRCQSY